MLSAQSNIGLVQEPTPQESLEAFANSPIQLGWSLQKEILSAKAFAAQQLRSYKIIVFDRTIEEDREVFLNLHHTLGFLTSMQLNNLRRYSIRLESLIGKPNAVIYVTAEPKTLKSRMLQDDRPSWLVEALDLQLELYETFEEHLRGPCLRLDTTYLSLAHLADIASWINATMMDAYHGLCSNNEQFNIRWNA
jgi:deoxyadenosine/deoxycytidine kinase